MAITAAVILAGAQTSTSPVTTASFTRTANRLSLLWVHQRRQDNITPAPATCPGFTQVAYWAYKTTGAQRGAITLLRYMGASNVTGTVAITHGASSSYGVAEFNGVDASGVNGANAVVQAVTSPIANPANANSHTLTLAAFGSSLNAAFGVFCHLISELTTPGTGFTELTDLFNATPAMGTQTEWKINDNTVDASWATNTSYGAIGCELKASVAPTVTLGLITETPTVFPLTVGLTTPVVLPTPSADGFKFELADKFGDSIGELRGTGRSWTPGVSRMAGVSVTLFETDPLAAVVDAGTHRLKIRDSTGALRYFGPIVTLEEEGDGTVSHVALNSLDAMWWPQGFVGDYIDDGTGVFYNNDPVGDIVERYFDSANGDLGFYGLTMGNKGAFARVDVAYNFKKALDVLTELAPMGPFEWAITYNETSPTTRPTMTLDLFTKMGADRSATVVLEYGTGEANCSTYKRVRTVQNQANWLWVRGASTGVNLVASPHDTSLVSTYNYERMDVVDVSDVGKRSLLDQIANSQVAYRKGTQEVIHLTSTVLGAPKYGADYVIGDTVWVRIVDSQGRLRTNGKARIWGVTMAFDDNGNEIPTFEMNPT